MQFLFFVNMSNYTDNTHTIFPILKTEKQLQRILKNYHSESVFILVDENTLPLIQIIQKIHTSLLGASIIEIKSGEAHKNIETCVRIWQKLSEKQINRNGLLINFGGGVITDLGGFVASTYKRGLDFLNIPTTLLAMTDAALGGKTGIDLDNFKNQIGVINSPVGIYYNTIFLSSLPKKELISGFAEVLKHGLISDKKYWLECSNTPLKDLDWDMVISGSIMIKSEIVKRDPLEKGERKLLNFGHTIGHAIESFMMNNDTPILHGEAVAAGMICESYLSKEIIGLKEEELKEITNSISFIFPKIKLDTSSFDAVIELMKNDKKNTSNDINFTLLKSIGDGTFNQHCSVELIKKSLAYYIALS